MLPEGLETQEQILQDGDAAESTQDMEMTHTSSSHSLGTTLTSRVWLS